MSRLLDGLTDAQVQAVTHGEGPLLVVAGAGTGKTRVVTRRIAWLAEQGTPPEHVLALTFSNKAADEMRERAEALIATPYEELSVSTFHAFAARLLHDEALEAGIDPFFQTITPAGRLALLLDRFDDLSLRHHEIRGNPASLVASFIERIDRLKDEMVTAEEYRAWAESLAKEAQDDAERAQARLELEFADVYAAHERLLAEAGTLDFGDLILRSYQLLRDRPHVRERAARRHHHVLVDEYQDTNFAQGLLLRLLVADHRNVCVVGDDDQSIYRFRGASQKNMVDFQREFPDARVVRLEENYRSLAPILQLAHAVIEPIPDRLEKRLRSVRSEAASGASATGAATEQASGNGAAAGQASGNGAAPAPAPEAEPRQEVAAVTVWRCASERAQAQAVAAEVERLLTGGTDPNRVCVLVRSVKSEGQAVAAALEERALPFRLHGAAAFFQRIEVRDALAWLRLLADPGDSSAVVRALTRPPVELRSVDLARLAGLARRRKLDMVAAIAPALEHPDFPPPAQDRMNNFLRLHSELSEAFFEQRPDVFVQRLVTAIGLRAQQLFAAHPDAVERLLNIAKFTELAGAYARREPQASARDFARYIAAVANAGMREDEATVEHAPPAVQVMTMHGAKGLEFDHVYVLGLTHRGMPGSRRRQAGEVPDALLKEALPEPGKEAHNAEMRRLLHVAMTRARDRLVLAWPETTGEGTKQRASAFLEEARAAAGLDEEVREEELFGPAEGLQSTFRMMRDELLETVSRVGGKLGELRLDTYLDVNHAVVRYLELLKLAALLDRDPGRPLEETLEAVNGLILQGATAEQRDVFESSGLDEYLLADERDEERRRTAIDSRLEPSLESLLPRRGEGLLLSATDIEAYRTCPLKYKYARVYTIPQEQTINQRFGILVHQVLERFHAAHTEDPAGANGGTLEELMGLFEAGWRRSGFGSSDDERQFRDKARAALTRYHELFRQGEGRPVWFERNFAFHVGPHLVRGRVDRVDELPGGGHELIDYKTGKPKTKGDLRDDIQLSLYQIGAREAWQLDASAQSYYYVLDNEKVPVERSSEELDAVRETVTTVADGILAQRFEPQPSYQACSWCDYRIICPAAEI